MTDNVHTLSVETRLPLDPARVLNAALAANLERVVVVGIDEHGEEYAASSLPSAADVVWLLERAKLNLLRSCE